MRGWREQHIGNPKGLIAVWCDKSEAIQLADFFPYLDGLRREILEAVELAYPPHNDEPEE